MRGRAFSIAFLLGVALVVGVGAAGGAPGALDPGFGSSGVVTTAIGGSDDEANAVALQPDGKIVAAGYSQNSPLSFALVRYDPNGSLDTSFGNGGKVTTANDGLVNGVAVQPDGKIVAVGRAVDASDFYAFELARYNPNGSLDTSFGSGGTIQTSIPSSYATAYAVALQPDGKILIAGEIYGAFADFALARYNPNGSLDTSFGSGGIVDTAFPSSNAIASAIALQPNGKIVAAGYYSTDPLHIDFEVVRYNANGSLDTGFGTGGEVTTPIGGSDDEASSIAVQSDGRIVVAGMSYVPPQNQFALVRYNANGSLDPTFGTGGMVTTPVGIAPQGGRVYALALQPDGKLVAAGEAYQGLGNEFTLARYNPTGSLDPGFGTGGKVTTTIGVAGDARAVALQPDGQAVVAGEAYVNSRDVFAVARYRDSTLTVRKVGTGAGTVSSSPAGIGCGSVCTAPFGAVGVTLTATPASGSVFSGWSGGCSGTSTCRVQLSTDQSVTATFTLTPCVVPKLKGKTLAAARRSIRSHDCSVGAIRRAKSSKVKKGRVISQKPRPASRLTHGAKVNLLVSKGR